MATATLKEYLTGFYRSLPVQLFILHLRRYQVLLIFWYILASAINGNFMSTFGADALFLAPEYLGNVNGVSMAIVGVATGVFIMSWNVTTFILHSNQVKFLATTSKPFLKYCINNAVIPLIFLLFYLGKTIYFDVHNELLSAGEIIVLIAEGRTNQQIADQLFLSAHTVNTHRKNIMSKLGVKNTAGIVMYAVKTNLISPNKFLFTAENEI